MNDMVQGTDQGEEDRVELTSTSVERVTVPSTAEVMADSRAAQL